MGCPEPPTGLPNAELLPVPLSPTRVTQVSPSISPAKVVVGGAATLGAGYSSYTLHSVSAQLCAEFNFSVKVSISMQYACYMILLFKYEQY